MDFSELDVTRRTRKGNFLNQIDQLIDWAPIEKAITRHYAPVSDAAGHPVYPGLLLLKMLLAGIWHGGLSDEAVEDMANSNLHVMRFLGLYLEDDVRDSFGIVPFQNPTDRSWRMGWIAGDDQWADTDARRHGDPGMSCGCEHHAQSTQA